MKEKLSGFHAGILMYMIQSGVLIFSLSHLEAQYFGTNGWLATLTMAVVVSVNISFIYAVYRLGKGRSIFEIMEQSISKALLFPLYFVISALWAVIGGMVINEYIFIFQMIAFPATNPNLFKLVVYFLAFILVTKGIYNISKAATVFFWLIIWMLFLFLYFLGEFEWTRLTPYIFKDGGNMAEGFLQIYSAFLGYELSLLLFPYVSKKTKLIRAVLMGHWFLAVNFTFSSIIIFGLFGYRMLKQMQFPLIDMLAYIEFPFVERIENLFYGFLLFSMMITFVAYIWASKETLQRIVPTMKPGVLSFIIVAACFGVSYFPDILSEVQAWLSFLTKFEIGVAFGLPLALIALLLIQRMRGGVSHDE